MATAAGGGELPVVECGQEPPRDRCSERPMAAADVDPRGDPGAVGRRAEDGGRWSSSRALTCILYLNPDWSEGDGGELQLIPFLRAPVRVNPRHGRLVVFLSDRVLHKVAPSFRTRYALTIFFGARYGKRAAEDPQAAKMRSLGYA